MSGSPPVISKILSQEKLPDNTTSTEAVANGRSWKKGAKILGAIALVIAAILSIAAFAIGIAALVSPAGLALVGGAIGAAVTSGLAWAAEYAIFILIPGVIGVGLFVIAAAISLLAEKTRVA